MAHSRLERSPQTEGPKECDGFTLIYILGTPTIIEFDLCSVIGCYEGESSWKGYYKYSLYSHSMYSFYYSNS